VRPWLSAALRTPLSDLGLYNAIVSVEVGKGKGERQKILRSISRQKVGPAIEGHRQQAWLCSGWSTHKSFDRLPREAMKGLSTAFASCVAGWTRGKGAVALRRPLSSVGFKVSHLSLEASPPQATERRCQASMASEPPPSGAGTFAASFTHPNTMM
jgi:hypothetical protein